MKQFIIISISIIIAFSSYAYNNNDSIDRKKESRITIQVSIIEKLKPHTWFNDKYVYYNAQIDIINNTDSIFSFWTMSCSWQGSWICNNDSIRLSGQACDKNTTIQKQINPHEKSTYIGILVIRKDIKRMDNIKLGLKLINKKANEDLETFLLKYIHYKYKKDEIIWSEPLNIIPE